MSRLVALGFAVFAYAAPLVADAPPTTAWQAYRSAQLALSREDFAKAEQQFRVAIREDRTFSLACCGLGTVMAVGVVGVAVGAATARGSIYPDNTTPVSVAPEGQVELLSIDPPSGSTIVTPWQRLQATFRVTMPIASQRPQLTLRMQNQLGGIACIQVLGIAGPQDAGVTFELTAAGPAEASSSCRAPFDIVGFSLTVQADDGWVVSDRFFPVRYTVVRPPGS